ncbi:hypothetical protein ACOMHN_063980 [Nucella lapillus]
MSNSIAPWNPLQLVVISLFTCFTTFFIPSESGVSLIAVSVTLLGLSGVSLIAVSVTLLGLCVPVLFIQIKLGGYLQKGIVGVFSMFFPIWKGVGIAALLDLLLRIASFAPLVAQFGTYAFIAISDDRYVWGQCHNLQLTTLQELCMEDETRSSIVYGSGDAHRPEELFYKYEFLQLSGDPTDIAGFPQWRFTEIARKAEVSLMPVTLAIVWVLVFLLVGFGGRVCGWVLFLLGPTAMACLLAVLGYGWANLDMGPTWQFLKNNNQVNLLNKEEMLKDWAKGFQRVMYSLPVWTSVAVTMGRMCGRGRVIRNVGWLLVVIVFILVSELPAMTMAPYIANMITNNDRSPNVAYSIGPGLMLWQMPAAFTTLAIPAVYAFIFFLAAFIFAIMFLSLGCLMIVHNICLGCLTIVDNIVISLEGCIERRACSKVAVHLLVTFFVMCVAKALGIIQTTKAGLYYSVLLDQSLFQFRFVLIILLALGLLVVYVKQNFALGERVIMAFWFASSALICSGLWFYALMTDKDQGFLYPSQMESLFSRDWDIVRWVIGALPLIGVPIGALHACYSAFGSGSPVCSKLFCGITERVREHQFDQLPPPPPA